MSMDMGDADAQRVWATHVAAHVPLLQRYRKRPVIVEAVQLRWSTWNEVCAMLGDLIGPGNPGRMTRYASDSCGEPGPEYIELTIPTLEGDMIAHHGDWIIRGVAGEFYPCKPDIFAQSYEMVVG